MHIFKEMGYAVWGRTDDLVGFIHCYEFADEFPIPEDRIPHVGDVVRARVVHVSNLPITEERLDVTAGGTVAVDFSATLRRIDTAQT